MALYRDTEDAEASSMREALADAISRSTLQLVSPDRSFDFQAIRTEVTVGRSSGLVALSFDPHDQREAERRLKALLPRWTDPTGRLSVEATWNPDYKSLQLFTECPRKFRGQGYHCRDQGF
jgi:hypothetical protein